MARWAWAISFCVGFLSLSQEIVWVRLVSYQTQGLPTAFAFVLSTFLLGIAGGAAIGKRLCARPDRLLANAVRVLAAAAAIDAAALPVLVLARPAGDAALAVTAVLIVLTAGAKSVMFPIAHHLGSDQSGSRLGRSVSKVYFGNILGSTLGPVVTGYVGLNLIGTDAYMALIATGSLCLAVALALRFAPGAWRAAAAGVTAVAVMLAAGARWPLVPRLARGADGQPAVATRIIEGRHGILHLSRDDKPGDLVFGGNAYDGRAIVDLATDPNGLDRALIALAAHERPERVLVIGMSTGAWAAMLTASPRIRELHVVEINPDYRRLSVLYPQVEAGLRDPRVSLHIDDGRRWLRRNPDERFDLIVQNTTWHWRANSSSLLSVEYMRLIRTHLREGGISAINGTLSPDVEFTARSVFPSVARYKSFVYGSDRPFGPRRAGADARLAEFAASDYGARIPGAAATDGPVAAMLGRWFDESPAEVEDPRMPAMTITDQNMVVEHLHGRWAQRHPTIAGKAHAIRRIWEGEPGRAR